MEQLIELLRQIEELAGVAIEALEGATSDAEGGKPAEAAPAGGGGEAPAAPEQEY
jgi:hypothetical protein